MALLGLDRLTKKDIFTAEIWNGMVDILEAKFASGISESDLAWPLLAEGDIDFQQSYGIVGLRSFWNIVNASEYASLDAAISAAEASGGGAVFIPPYTTISANAASIDTSNIIIFGAGPSSVIKITASATGPLIDTASSGISGVRIMNLTLDGTGGGAGCVGVRVRQVTRFQMLNVYMTGFTGDFIYLTNDGTAGNASTDAYLANVHCSGGSDSHLVSDDISGLTIVGFTSKSASGDAISLVPVGSSNLIKDISLNDVRIDSGGAKGIRILGSGASGIDAQSRIHLRNCHVNDCTGLPFELGGSSTLLKTVTVIGCSGPASASDGMRLAANSGLVVGFYGRGATGDGIDASNCVDVEIATSNCQDAGAYGIVVDSSTDCTVHNNNLRDAATAGISSATAAGLIQTGNVGHLSPTASSSFVDTTQYTRSAGSGAGTISGFSKTIPAYSVKDGDLVKVSARCTQGGGGTGSIQLRAGSNGLGTITLDGDGAHAEWLIKVAASGSGVAKLTGVHISGANTVSTSSSLSADWTADLTLTFYAATLATQDIAVTDITIELIGGE